MNNTILTAILTLTLAGLSCATVIPVPPNEESVRGAWVGFSELAIDFHRLSLASEGGLFAFSDAGHEPRVYRIDAWKISKSGQLNIQVTPISPNAYRIVVNGKASISSIQLEVKDHKGGWRKSVTLYREDNLQRGFERVKTAMKHHNEQ